MLRNNSIKRIATIFIICASLAFNGCAVVTAEYQNSGGFVDSVLDKYWFKADTKQMRVLRSYSLIGSLLRLSTVGRTKAERNVMAAQITDTVEKSMQAAVCAYTEPCFFFDDLMADLDQSLFKLAVLCFDTKENDDLYAEMQSKIVGKVPVLGETVTAVTKILDASASTVKVAARIAEVGSSLLKIGKTGLGNL